MIIELIDVSFSRRKSSQNVEYLQMPPKTITSDALAAARLSLPASHRFELCLGS